MGTYIKKPIRPAAEFLDNHVGPADIVGYTNESVIHSIIYYRYPKFPFYRFFDPAFPDLSWNRPIVEYNYCKPFFKIHDLNFKKLWLIATDWPRSGGFDDQSRSVKGWLDNNYTRTLTKEIDGLFISCYEPRA